MVATCTGVGGCELLMLPMLKLLWAAHAWTHLEVCQAPLQMMPLCCLMRRRGLTVNLQA